MTTRAASDRDRFVERGLSPAEAERKSDLLARTRAALDGAAPHAVASYWVPGRIEVLGKHTDYAGGRSLLCATERGFVVSARPRDDDRLIVTDVVNDAHGEFIVSPDQPARTHWHNYPATVARRLARNFGSALRGVDLAFGSDLPRASGLSSSTALIIGVFAALADRNRLDTHAAYLANIRREEDLAGYLGTVENGRTFGTLEGDSGVGTRGGSQDHTAILCSRPGRLVRYRFGPVEREGEITAPEGCTFVVASSGVAASKTGAARERYNRGAAMVAALLDRWREATGQEADTLGGLHRRDGAALDRLRALVAQPHGGFSPEELTGRLDQFAREALVFVPDAAIALATGDLTRFGTLVDQSQAAAEHGLRNQVPETISLARLARELGAVAASAFGAGFGGSVWALVANAELERFIADWGARYAREHPEPAARAELFSTRAGPAFLRL